MVAIHPPADAAAIPRYGTIAGELEASGYDGIWIGEVNTFDAVTATAMAAIGTERAEISVLLNTFTRAPTTLAMTASTLARVAGGRLNVILGVASPLLVERWNGISYRQPHARLRDVLRFLRRALEGGRVDLPFATFSSEGFALASPPAEPPGLLVAACGPRALELAAREGDGVVLNWISPEDLERIDPLPDDRSRVSLVVPVCPVADRAAMEARMRPTVTDYLQAPAYAAQQRRLGRATALEPMWAAWGRGDRHAARAALPTVVLDELVVWGDPARCRSRLDDIERKTGAHVMASFFLPAGTQFHDVAYVRPV